MGLSVPPAQRGRLGLMVSKGRKANKDRRATQARKVSLGPRAPWVRQEVPEHKVSKVGPVRKVRKVRKDSKDLRVLKDRKAWSDPPGHKVRRATPLGQRPSRSSAQI